MLQRSILHVRVQAAAARCMSSPAVARMHINSNAAAAAAAVVVAVDDDGTPERSSEQSAPCQRDDLLPRRCAEHVL